MNRYDVRKLLEAAVDGRGFTKRGDAFFRIMGDGVLQVLKFEYEPCFTHFSLHVGLLSMYSELEQSWFTSVGCVPQYCVMNFVGGKNAIDVKVDGDGIYTFNVISPQSQIQILNEAVFCVLDKIQDQGQLIYQMTWLDAICHGNILWNDRNKIAPYLKSGDLRSAEKVLGTILMLHKCPIVNSDLDSPALFTAKMPEGICEQDKKLTQQLNWVREGDWRAINIFLDCNRKRNDDFARFITSK